MGDGEAVELGAAQALLGQARLAGAGVPHEVDDADGVVGEGGDDALEVGGASDERPREDRGRAHPHPPRAAPGRQCRGWRTPGAVTRMGGGGSG